MLSSSRGLWEKPGGSSTKSAGTPPHLIQTCAEAAPLLRLTRWALYITAAALPLYVVRWRVGPIPTTLLEALILITAGLYAITVLRHRGPLPRRTQLDIPIAFFLLAGVIGVFVAPDHRGALGIFRAYLVEPVALYYIALAVISAGAAIDALYLAGGIGLMLFVIVDLAWFGHALVTNTLVPGHAAAAFNIDSNSVALYLEPPIGVAAGLAIFSRGKRRLSALGLLAAMLVAELATLSRGGLLALGALAMIAVLSLPSLRWKVGVAVAAVLTALVLPFVPLIGPRVIHIFDPHNGTLAVRAQIWVVTMRMLGHHPVFGAGINAYQSTMAPYRTGNAYLSPEPYPHNIFLTSWTELGLLGLAAFAWILGVLIVSPWRALRGTSAELRPLLWGLGTAFVLVLVHGLVDSPYWKNDLSAEFWILAAVEMSVLRAVRKVA